jgi:predicted choloylglycine hydrolase
MDAKPSWTTTATLQTGNPTNHRQLIDSSKYEYQRQNIIISTIDDKL